MGVAWCNKQKGFWGSRERGGGRKIDKNKETNASSIKDVEFSNKNVAYVSNAKGATATAGSILSIKEQVSNVEDNDNFTSLVEKIRYVVGANTSDTMNTISVTTNPSKDVVSGHNSVQVEDEETCESAEIQIPLSSILDVKATYENSSYGYFLRKRMAFPVMEHYVLNVWKKFGIVKAMINRKGFFCFKFSLAAGRDVVLKNDPWLIRNVPIILKKWFPSECLLKEELISILVLVELHDVPVTTFTEDGLSAIAFRLGTPIMPDSYLSTMCIDSFGFLFAYYKVEYEWKMPRCGSCSVFGHDDILRPNTNMANLGADLMNKQFDKSMGFKSKSTFVYRPISTPSGSGTSKKQGSLANIWASTSRTLNEHDKVFENVDMTKARNEAKPLWMCQRMWMRVMLTTRCGSKSLYEHWKESYDEDPYNEKDYEACDLTKDQMAFGDA
ncbi:zinc knuckle CX2CX4HX4C containing protein [Tanacetum coccineum]